jgi:hypothetical protein
MANMCRKAISFGCFSRGSNIPVAPKGHRWRKVQHDNTVTWLASWVENVQGNFKYVMLNPSSKLKVRSLSLHLPLPQWGCFSGKTNSNV